MGHGDDLAIVDAHFPAVSMAQRLVRLDGVDAPVLSRKLFANVNSLFANESEIVILGLECSLRARHGKRGMAICSGSFQGWTIRWRERRFIVAGYAGMDAFVTAVATDNFDAQG